MPTQNPWAWALMGVDVGAQCRALMSSKAFGDRTKNIQDFNAWYIKAMTMCESYLTKTYLKISGASSCKCIGIPGCLRYNQESFTWGLGKSLVIW